MYMSIQKHIAKAPKEAILTEAELIKDVEELNKTLDHKPTLWQKIYYPCYRFVNKFNPKDRGRDIRHFIQRGRRGYDETTWYWLDEYLVDIIPPQLRKLGSDKATGYPSDIPENYTDDQLDGLVEAWHQELLKAADDIEALYKHEQLDFPKTKEARDKYFADRKIAEERTKQGFLWVSSHIFSLWD